MLSVPVAIERVNENNMDAHVEEFKRIHADRVFFCLFKNFMDGEEKLRPQLEKFALMRDKLHAVGIEAGIWLDDLGHGMADLGYKSANKMYTPLEGVFSKSKDSFCPLDKKFQTDYASYLKTIAKASPDIIMLDDDFRFSVRNYGIGCFCKLHRREFFTLTGKRYSKLRLFQKAFTGGANPTRDAWLEVSGKSLENFAHAMRKAVDSVNKNIRLGCCMCLDTLDFAGTDALTLAKAFAGDTKPFFRTSGAPYWQAKSPWGDSRAVAEYTRQEMAWFDGVEVEMFAEGDVYPRPRYVVPANYLECYDAYLAADGRGGDLKYMFDYNYELGYETGYIEHHIKNYETIKNIGEAFRRKKQIGVEIFEPMKKIKGSYIEKTILPRKDFLPPPPSSKVGACFNGLIRKVYNSALGFFEKTDLLPTLSFGRAQRLTCGVPTTYSPSDGAVICFGESARSLPDSYLSRGLILDARAAKILTERGIDVGFISDKRSFATAEKFSFGDDSFLPKCRYLRALTCNEKADIVSRYLPDNQTASYIYTNQNGQTFYVLGLDGTLVPLRGDETYFDNYYRQRAIIEGIQKVSKKPLPARCEKNTNLSVLCAKGKDGSVTVGLFNFFTDGIVQPKIELSEPKTNIECIGCKAHIEGSTVIIDTEIPPFGFASFTAF